MIISSSNFDIKTMDFENAGFASSYIKKELKRIDVPKNIIRRIAIATYEAEINVVIHSFGGFCHYNIHENRITVKFKDIGPGIKDIQKAMLKGFSTANQEAKMHGFGAGMGLVNINEAVDEFRIVSSEKGTIIEFTVYFEVNNES